MFKKQFKIYVFILFALTIGKVNAIVPLKNSRQVGRIENNLQHLENNIEKVETILNLSTWYFKHYDDSKIAADKSLRFAYEALSLSESIKYAKGISESHLQLAIVLQWAKQYLKAKGYAKKAVQGFEKLNLQDQLGESWVMFWSASFLTGTPYKERIPLLQNAAAAFRKSGNKEREADCYKELGDIYQLLGNGPDAIASLKKSLTLYKKTNYQRLCGVYDLMGSVYLDMGDYKTAILFGLEASRLAEKLNDKSIFLSVIYSRIGTTYFEFQDYQNAKIYFLKSLDIAIKFNDIRLIRILTYDYSNTLLKQNKTLEALTFINNMKVKHPQIFETKSILLKCQYIEIYLRLKQYANAMSYVNPIKSDIKNFYPYKDLDQYKDLLTAYVTLMKLSFKLKKYSETSLYLVSYDSIVKKLKNNRYYAFSSFWKYSIDSAQGYCNSAMNNYREYVRHSRNLYDENKAKQINQMTILYETEKKDNNIIQLQNSSIIQKNKLRQAKLFNNLMIVSIFLLLIILTLLYRVYRLKQRTNKILSYQQNEINQKNNTLQNLVNEKEWLLKEIHHRVKNNLHMVVGLLASQSEYLKNEEAIQAINDSQNRIQAMSLIHQKLYQSENLSIINMPSYIFELTEYLKDSFNTRNSIRFILDIDNFDLPLSHSIPIGLIFNEAVTNAIKYAFPNNKKGKINISLKAKSDHEYILTIQDNGIGLPPEFDAYNNPSLGIKLMYGLSNDINGNFKIINEDGTKVSLEFTINETNID